jgi:hypothetical protein
MLRLLLLLLLLLLLRTHSALHDHCSDMQRPSGCDA